MTYLSIQIQMRTDHVVFVLIVTVFELQIVQVELIIIWDIIKVCAHLLNFKLIIC